VNYSASPTSVSLAGCLGVQSLRTAADQLLEACGLFRDPVGLRSGRLATYIHYRNTVCIFSANQRLEEASSTTPATSWDTATCHSANRGSLQCTQSGPGLTPIRRASKPSRRLVPSCSNGVAAGMQCASCASPCRLMHCASGPRSATGGPGPLALTMALGCKPRTHCLPVAYSVGRFAWPSMGCKPHPAQLVQGCTAPRGTKPRRST